MSYFYTTMDSPVGALTLTAKDNRLVSILWSNDKPGRVKKTSGTKKDNYPVLKQTKTQLKEYFAQKRTTFDIPLYFEGTHFQKQVWQALQNIPYGKTKSYSEIATEVNSPQACRAVGAANGRNPLSIVVPCHRVIGKNGKLTGFAGGLDKKEFLLSLESKI